MRLLLPQLACGCLTAPVAWAEPSRDVLVLFSNCRLLQGNIEIDQGLPQEMGNRSDRDVEMFVEFLDHPAFSGPAYEQTADVYLREKYATRMLEVVIVAGDIALDFVLRCGQLPSLNAHCQLRKGE